MATRIDAQGRAEIVERRTRNSKTFQLPDGKVRIATRLHPVHWDDGGAWREVDDSLITNDGGVTWRTSDTPYELQWSSDTLTLSYRSRKGGDECRIRLLRLNDVPVVTPAPVPTVTGNRVSAFVAPELEIVLVTRAHGVELFKILHGPLAPTSLTWGVQVGDDSKLRFDLMNTSGRDNILRLARPVGLNRVRRIEMTHSRTPDDFVTVLGRNTYEVTETFTGRTRFINPTTSARTWRNEREYPVEIDVTVSESIGAADDDGTGYDTAYWITTPMYNRGYSGNRYAGMRFQTVNVPQGQTLDSATLTINVTSRSGTQNSVISGEDVDDAAAWANASAFSPNTMSATTANTTFATPATTGIKAINVLSSVQEIIDRAGWAANNDLRLGWTDVSAMTASYFFIEDYAAAGTAEAELAIIYTVGGGSRPKFLMMMGVS